MRFTILLAAICVVGCASQPSAPEAAPAASGDTASLAPAAGQKPQAAKPQTAKKAVPERIKGAYKVVMKGDKKMYCTKELATGSHVNYRTICLTPEEYADLEARARDWKDEMRSITPPTGPAEFGRPR